MPLLEKEERTSYRVGVWWPERREYGRQSIFPALEEAMDERGKLIKSGYQVVHLWRQVDIHLREKLAGFDEAARSAEQQHTEEKE